MRGLARISTFLLVFTLLAVSGPGAGHARADTVNIRPLSDWLFPPHVPTGNWTGPLEKLPEGWFLVTYVGPLHDGVNGTTTITGDVVERQLESGRVEVTVSVFAKNAPLTIYRLQDRQDWLARHHAPPLPTPVLGAGSDGSLDFHYTLVFLVNAIGEPLPVNIPAGDVLRAQIVGNGTGTFTAYAAAFGFTPGATGEVHVLQTGLFAVSRISQGEALEDQFPGELVNVKETGR